MASEQSSILASNLGLLADRIRISTRRAGREESDVQLVTVTKYAQLDWVRDLVDLGVTIFGESRPQQLVERSDHLPQAVEWHLIGHLQRNKVRLILPHVSLIHSVDSLRLLARINEVASELSLQPRVLLEVNISGEASKNGFTAETLCASWDQIIELGSVQVTGLMTMAPFSEDAEASRPFFAGLRQLRDELSQMSSSGTILSELSMGMSGDFEVAIEEGATLVRVGRALYAGLDDDR